MSVADRRLSHDNTQSMTPEDQTIQIHNDVVLGRPVLPMSVADRRLSHDRTSQTCRRQTAHSTRSQPTTAVCPYVSLASFCNAKKRGINKIILEIGMIIYNSTRSILGSGLGLYCKVTLWPSQYKRKHTFCLW